MRRYKKYIKVVKTLLMISLFILCPGRNLQSKDTSIVARYFSIRISNSIYQAAEVRQGQERFKAVIDAKGDLVADRDIIAKVFFVGNICGYYPEPGQRSYRFNNYLQVKVWQWQKKLLEAQDIIPKMEILNWWAFDAGPRVIAEAIRIAVTGGISATAETTQAAVVAISSETAKLALRNLVKNPRLYLVTTIYFLLGESIAEMQQLERKILAMKNSDILDYEKVRELDDIYWRAVPKGNGAIRMYQRLSGDIVSNLLRALSNWLDQLIREMEYSHEKITSIFLAKQFQNMSVIKTISQVYAEEISKWIKWREEEQKLLFSTEDTNKAVRASGITNRKLKSALLLGIRCGCSEEEYQTLLGADWGIMFFDGILFQRNDELWRLEVKEAIKGGSSKDYIIISSVKNPNKKIRLGDLTDEQIPDGYEYLEDTFKISYLGNEVLSIQGYSDSYSTGGVHPSSYQYSMVVRISDYKEMRIDELFGENIRTAFQQSAAKCYSEATNSVATGILADDKNFIILHEKGQWNIIGHLYHYDPEIYRGAFTDFTVPIESPNSLLGYNELYPVWGIIKKNVPDAIDAVSSPVNDLLIVITKNKFLFFKGFDETSIGKAEKQIDFNINPSIVMIQWVPEEIVVNYSNEINRYKRK